MKISFQPWEKILFVCWFVCSCALAVWDYSRGEFGWISMGPFLSGAAVLLIVHLQNRFHNKRVNDLFREILARKYPNLTEEDIKVMIKQQREEWHI